MTVAVQQLFGYRPAVIDGHIEWCRRRGLRATYIEEIRRTLNRVSRALPRPLQDATSGELEAWWNALEVSDGTRNAYIAHIAGYYTFLRREGLRDDDPTSRLIRPRVQRRLPRPIDQRRLKRALRTAPWPICAWLSLACYMGLRCHEIAGLCGEDVTANELLVRDGKGGKQRILPLHPEIARLLADMPLEGPVFVNAYGNPLTANTVSKRANRFLHDQGISETIHQCRHWFGTETYRHSKDLRLVQELMGHAWPSTTAGYAAWDRSGAAAVVNLLCVE